MSSLPRLAFAYRRPPSQTPHDHPEHTVDQVADQFVGPSKGNRRSLSEAVVLALQKRWRRLPPTKQSPSQMEGDCFYRRLVPAPVTFPDSRQPDRHSIPIALGPAQFNEFYRQCPLQVFPTLRTFFGGGAPPIECSSLSSPSSLDRDRSRKESTAGERVFLPTTHRTRRTELMRALYGLPAHTRGSGRTKP